MYHYLQKIFQENLLNIPSNHEYLSLLEVFLVALLLYEIPFIPSLLESILYEVLA